MTTLETVLADLAAPRPEPAAIFEGMAEVEQIAEAIGPDCKPWIVAHRRCAAAHHRLDMEAARKWAAVAAAYINAAQHLRES